MIHIVLGTKAQLIKMAPVMVKMAERGIPFNFIHTGQHRATMDEMLEEFGIKKPDIVLYGGPDIVSLGQMFFWTMRTLTKCVLSRKRFFGSDRHGIVLVHGDTFSTLLGALMGRTARLKVGHVESGLRSFDIFHPFPEEIVRRTTFRLSDILFCPGRWAVDNVASLRKEKVNTFFNTMVDTIAMAGGLDRRREHVPPGPFAIASLHRYENIFNRRMLEEIIGHLERIAGKMPLLFILHPPTDGQLKKQGFYERLEANPKIDLRPRYSYFDFNSLMEKAEFVVTDGGSVQEECACLGMPCLLMRKATERREGLGENAVLSEYSREIIDTFVEGYSRYRREPLSPDVNPSDIIIDSLEGYA